MKEKLYRLLYTKYSKRIKKRSSTRLKEALLQSILDDIDEINLLIIKK